jgi:hypothetical protein
MRISRLGHYPGIDWVFKPLFAVARAPGQSVNSVFLYRLQYTQVLEIRRIIELAGRVISVRSRQYIGVRIHAAGIGELPAVIANEIIGFALGAASQFKRRGMPVKPQMNWWVSGGMILLDHGQSAYHNKQDVRVSERRFCSGLSGRTDCFSLAANARNCFFEQTPRC